MTTRAVTNTISVIGVIGSEKFSHESYGEKFYEYLVECERLSEATDVLPVIISERIYDLSKLTIGTIIHVKGQIRTYEKYCPVKERTASEIAVFTKDLEVIPESSYEIKDNEDNDVFLEGKIGKPVVFRTTLNGYEISQISLLVQRTFNNTDSIPCIVWGRNARYANTLKTGDVLRIWGRMQSRKYKKRFGEGENDVREKMTYEISVNKLEVLNGGEPSDAE